MADIVEKGNIEGLVGYTVLDDEIKRVLNINPQLRKDVEKWLDKHVGKGHMSAIKACKVEYIDYDAIDLENMDEFEVKEVLDLIRKNNRECPNHRTCPLFISNNIVRNEKCTLELMDTQHLTSGLVKELEIEPDDFNDQIIVGQLVAMNIVYNRAMRGLSSAPLIEEVKNISKGMVNIDTKVNENFTVAERTLNLMEKLRKSLLLNRDDKLKVKQVKKANSEASAKQRVEELVKQAEQNVNSTNWADEIEDIEI